MTPKQERFCEEYLIDLNATQAAIRAGYSERTANKIASQNLAKLDIREQIEKLKSERSRKAEINAQMVVEGLARIANIDPRRMYKPDGTMIDPKDLPEDVAMAVAGIEHGDKGIKVKLNDRVRALELLGRHLAMFTDRVEAQIQASGSVTIYLPDNKRQGDGATGSDGSTPPTT